MNTNILVTCLTILGGLVGIVTGLLALQKHFRRMTDAKIVSPGARSENGGRWLSIKVHVSDRRWKSKYWIAVQPDDCRSEGWWWPQNEPLNFASSGSASADGIRLGRELHHSHEDVGKAFTIALFEVDGVNHKKFEEYAAKDERMKITSGCVLLHSIEVQRVRR